METQGGVKIVDVFAGVPPSGGSLEIGNFPQELGISQSPFSSPFGGIPRNWKPSPVLYCPGRDIAGSPFGGIPRNWKLHETSRFERGINKFNVPPSGGSLEIGNPIWLA